MDEQQIIDSLIEHFGAEYAEEIAETYDNGYFEVDGNEWKSYESEEEAERDAVEQVSNDLHEQPEMFNQDWLQQHVYISDTDKRIIAGDEADDYVDEIVRNDLENYTDELNVPDEYLDDPEEWSELEDALEGLRHTKYEEVKGELEDPIQYFVRERGMYSTDDLFQSNFIQIDVDSAAKEAINIDGWAHFLSHYDGDYEEINGGVVVFRM
jgi:hypothetical protein